MPAESPIIRTMFPRIRNLCLLAVAAAVCGCAQPSALHDASFKPLPNIEDRVYGVDIDTLELALPDAFVRMHWGMAKLDNQITALRAEAWTPDDRPVTVIAHKAGDGELTVQVKVGRFGDAEEQAAFHKALGAAIEELRDRA